MSATILTVSCAGRDEAMRIARALVDQRLAACVHLRPHDSVYRWQGAVEEAAEIGLLIKTTPTQAEAAAALVRALHSYTLPAILFVDAQADPRTAGWLASETATTTQA
jgi:periplasmic divalent cation tolerance protein